MSEEGVLPCAHRLSCRFDSSRIGGLPAHWPLQHTLPSAPLTCPPSGYFARVFPLRWPDRWDVALAGSPLFRKDCSLTRSHSTAQISGSVCMCVAAERLPSFVADALLHGGSIPPASPCSVPQCQRASFIASADSLSLFYCTACSPQHCARFVSGRGIV